MRRWLIRSCLVTSVLSLTCLSFAAQAAGFDHVAKLADKGFVISAQARLLDSGDVLGALNPTQPLSPASVTKLYTAAASLDRWGPQHRFTTRLVSTGDVGSDGVLHGDLVLDGGGDPALTSEELWLLIQKLRERGIHRIDGQLVVSQWRFGPVGCETTDRCKTQTEGTNAYGALLSSAAVNYASWCATVMPAQVGQPAHITSCDTVAPTLRIDNDVKTVAAGQAASLYAKRVTDSSGDTLRVSGQIPAGTYPRPVYKSSSNPADQTGQTLYSLLSQAGIQIGGGYTVSQQPPPISAKPLAAVEGKPLQELLLRTLNYSNNFMADTLAMDLTAGSQQSLPSAGHVLEQFAAGLSGSGPVTLRSGSGLTPENRVSAQDVNALLAAMYGRASLFPTFVAGMQVPTNGPMHFIRRGSQTFQDHVMLKTGTLNEPVTVRAIAGYFRTESGRWGSFSVLVNGTASTPYLSWRQTLPLIADDVTAMIENH
ncbi:D-alanyl-D-alanine carboxypeptidase/D-alanyl-D-alanine endopeptidase [Salinicola rhizosphaerae]|uniref:D-alanyl-D-alanine carboxypeptidase n=1 Tax=Salinicola rhizosphaerae TaxID=1443141 RepID=A0ABQ3ECS3_9GAMM|nr:D-alanyl-D-alanine carboxypeptidase/D-alanyl-D-alanine-endopeptidase [Salinicola rhizosphaerae]GHB32328.1 D-alanyl-D-alanine carboxypeptidase [Salinicola rhizosphaerae]